jgi:hypothetical protein
MAPARAAPKGGRLGAGKGGFLNLFNAAVLGPIPHAVNPILRRGRPRKWLGNALAKQGRGSPLIAQIRVPHYGVMEL